MIDHFDLEHFAAVLPEDAKHVGLIDNEHCWILPTPHPQLRILIRSTIDELDESAGCGEDSIRLIIEEDDGHGKWQAIGKGPDAYTTRVHGWEQRLANKIKEVQQRAQRVRLSIQPGERVFFVKKDGPNKGRPFAKNNSRFRWLD
jgi:hypothetical protein